MNHAYNVSKVGFDPLTANNEQPTKKAMKTKTDTNKRVRAVLTVIALKESKAALCMAQFKSGELFWVPQATIPEALREVGRVLFCRANVGAEKVEDLVISEVEEPSPTLRQGANYIYTWLKVRNELKAEYASLHAENEFYSGFNTELRDSRGKDIDVLFNSGRQPTS